MTERFTTDVPAIPDPNYVYLNELYNRDHYEEEDRIAQTRQEAPSKHYDYLVEDYFEQSGSQAFIDRTAVYDNDGRLNIDLTSQKIGIPYDFDMSLYADSMLPPAGYIAGLPGFGRPMPYPETRIHLDKTREFLQVTFGHEIGHYFWAVVEGNVDMLYGQMEEDFCDYFGRRMAFPRKVLAEYESIDETELLDIFAKFRGGVDDTIRALMEAGSLPPRIAIDTYNGKFPNLDFSEKVSRSIHCLHCSQVDGDYNCPSAKEPTPLFDFTDRAWATNLGGYCGAERVRRPDILSSLTKHYENTETQPVLFRPGWLGSIVLSNASDESI